MNIRNNWKYGGDMIWGLVLALLLGPRIVCAAGGAEEAGKPVVVAADTAIVDVQLPPGAKVIIDGAESRKTHFTYRPFAQGQTRMEEVRVRFRDGKEITRSVLLRGGWYLRLPVKQTGGHQFGLVVPMGHIEAVSSVAFSPDGKHVLTGSDDKTAILWDARTGAKLRTFQGHTVDVFSVAFSPDGKHVLTGSWDNTAILWDARTGEKLRTFQGHSEGVSSVAFSPDGKHVLTGSWDKMAILWDAQSGEKLRTFQGHADKVTSVAFRPDGKHVLTGSEDNTAILWETRTGQKLRTFQGHTHFVDAVAFSPDGKRVLTGSGDDTAILWDAQTRQKIHTFQGHTQFVDAVAFSPDGKHVLTGSGDKTAILWDAQTGEKLRTFQGHRDVVRSVAFSPDGKHVLTGSDDNTAIVWDARIGQKLRTFFQEHTSFVTSVAFSLDGKHVLTGSGDKTATLWEARTGQKPRTFQGHRAAVRSVASSPDGKHVLTGSGDKSAILWEAQTGQKLRTFQGHALDVFSVAFSPDGKHLLTGSTDKTAILWDAQTGEKLRTFQGHRDVVRSVAFSPDGKHVLTGSWDNTAILWETQTGQKLRSFQRHTNFVISVAFSPDGKHVLTGSGDKTAVLWNAQTGKKLRTFQGHTGGVISVAFSPDGKHVLTGSGDKTAILWDARSGQKLRTFKGHASVVTSVAFSPGGKYVVTSSGDGTTRLWDIATGDELARLISLDAGLDWLVVTPEGLFDGSVGGRQLVSYRIGTGLNVVPVDRFFQDFYRPGLLADLFKGQRPMPEVELAKNRPPTLRILSPKDGGIAEDNEVTLEVEAVDEGGGVQGPWLFHNGARRLDRSEPQTIGKRVLRRFSVALVEGDNHLEVKAASGDGSWESEPAVITLRYAKPLARPELYLLAIGIDRYAEDTLRLKFARADAQALADVFNRRGKTLYRDVHPVILLDERATKAVIIKTLQDIARKAKRQDTLLVFVAGHGTMIGQRYYFIPYEFRRGDAALEDAIRKQGLAADVLADYLATVPVLKRMLILDTCASGGAVGLTSIKRNPFAFRGAIERLSRSQGVFTLAAAASGEEAGEVQELGHGVLSYALLAGLNAVAEGPLKDRSIHPGNAERVASVLEWFNFASGQVPRLTKRYFGREQDVQMSSQGNSFPVLPVEDK